MAIKLVTIDIDDTLVNTKKEISPRTLEAVKAATAKGVKIVLTTGRPLPGVVRYLDELGLNHQDDQFVVNYNGGMVQTTNGHVLGGASLTPVDYHEIKQWANEMGDYLQIEAQDKAYTSNHVVPIQASEENSLVRMPLHIVTDEEINNVEFVKGMVIGTEQEIERYAAELPVALRDKYYVVRSTPNFLEFMHPEATKGNGLKVLAEHLQIPMTETMAMGDQENDITMLETAEVGVAMGNAVERVKDVADVVTATQNEDGVAKALEKYVL